MNGQHCPRVAYSPHGLRLVLVCASVYTFSITLMPPSIVRSQTAVSLCQPVKVSCCSADHATHPGCLAQASLTARAGRQNSMFDFYPNLVFVFLPIQESPHDMPRIEADVIPDMFHVDLLVLTLSLDKHIFFRDFCLTATSRANDPRILLYTEYVKGVTQEVSSLNPGL